MDEYLDAVTVEGMYPDLNSFKASGRPDTEMHVSCVTADRNTRVTVGYKRSAVFEEHDILDIHSAPHIRLLPVGPLVGLSRT